MVDVHKIIKDFFRDEFPQFSLIDEYSYFRYWGIIYSYKFIRIKIDEEISLMIDIFIENTKYSLWQYDRSVNDKMDTSKENIIYQLNVLKRFLNEVGY